MHARRFVVLLMYFLTVILSVAVMAKKYSSDKRIMGPSGFQTMMRYGRSGTFTTNRRSDKQVNVKIHPRGDAFFLGPRYGKRSNWNPNASLIYPVSPIECHLDENNLFCTYTGISDLYRCISGFRKNKAKKEIATSN